MGKMQRVFVGVFSRIQSKARASWSTVVQATMLRRIMRGPASSGEVGRSATANVAMSTSVASRRARRRFRRSTPRVLASWRGVAERLEEEDQRDDERERPQGHDPEEVPQVECPGGKRKDEGYGRGDLKYREEPLGQVVARFGARPDVEHEHREQGADVQDELRADERLAAEERVGVIRDRLEDHEALHRRGRSERRERADDAGYREQEREPAPAQGGATRIPEREERDTGRPRGPQPDGRVEAHGETEER